MAKRKKSSKRKTGHRAKFARIAKKCNAEVTREGVTGKRRFKAVGACVKREFKKA